jgi:mannonate dehydratase
MQEYGMVLLGHAGNESAINVKKFNQLGNPLLYRAALDAGLKVLMAHCAGLGMGKDLDAAKVGSGLVTIIVCIKM